jgi:hypothetical protein
VTGILHLKGRDEKGQLLDDRVRFIEALEAVVALGATYPRQRRGTGRDKETVSKIANPIGKAPTGLVWSAATCRRF